MTQYLPSVHGTGESPYATPEEMERALADTGVLNERMRRRGAWSWPGKATVACRGDVEVRPFPSG